jgi:dUTP pyrophosphatase
MSNNIEETLNLIINSININTKNILKLWEIAVQHNMDLLVEDPDIKILYQEQIEKNNKSPFGIDEQNSGFDLFCPTDVVIKPGEKILYNLGIKLEPKFAGGYYLYPRSSFGKTPLRLCNSVGIIDNSYRGNIMAMVENIGNIDCTFKKGERYFQLCHPSLIAMNITCVDKINEDTIRGAGGYGSTGK